MTKEILFTARGDDGSTGLLGNGRYPKSDSRFEVLGSLDECSAILGLAKSLIDDPKISELITAIQRDLYQIMGEVSVLSENRTAFPQLSADVVLRLENSIFDLNKEAHKPDGFIIPGDSTESAILDVARTIVRRAERRISQYFDEGKIDNLVIRQYINRLSSLIFSLELVIVQRKKKTHPTMAKSK